MNTEADKCPTCADASITTIAEEETCMGWQPFRDEAGRKHSHNPNRTTSHLVCSNGHRFSVVRPLEPCEVCELVKAGVI